MKQLLRFRNDSNENSLPEYLVDETSCCEDKYSYEEPCCLAGYTLKDGTCRKYFYYMHGKHFCWQMAQSDWLLRWLEQFLQSDWSTQADTEGNSHPMQFTIFFALGVIYSMRQKNKNYEKDHTKNALSWSSELPRSMCPSTHLRTATVHLPFGCKFAEWKTSRGERVYILQKTCFIACKAKVHAHEMIDVKNSLNCKPGENLRRELIISMYVFLC